MKSQKYYPNKRSFVFMIAGIAALAFFASRFFTYKTTGDKAFTLLWIVACLGVSAFFLWEGLLWIKLTNNTITFKRPLRLAEEYNLAEHEVEFKGIISAKSKAQNARIIMLYPLDKEGNREYLEDGRYELNMTAKSFVTLAGKIEQAVVAAGGKVSIAGETTSNTPSDAEEDK